MITLIEALRFRCLRYVSQPLDPFHVLVGPNASGKTTFLDVVGFLGDLVSGGIEKAVAARTANFQDLTWRREGGSFELAIEARIPDELRPKLKNPGFDTVRYEIAMGLDEETQEIRLIAETLLLKASSPPDIAPSQVLNFPKTVPVPETILVGFDEPQTEHVSYRRPDGNDRYVPETPPDQDHASVLSFRPSAQRTALANLPADESKFPVANWLKTLLMEGVQKLVLNSLLIRQASPPGQGKTFRPDGSNLPWVVADLEKKAPDRIQDWIAHLQTSLPDLESIETIERPDDKHRYLMLGYKGGVRVPSWMASDGTLRLLALTLPAYLPELSGIYLIEEPENGIHPRAVETMFQSLSSVYDAQILMATHSPVILSLVSREQLLCFAKTADGATDIVLGKDHPALREWQGETNLSVLFAAGVLGYAG